MVVDLRSDTVTRPTMAMYKAMAEARVGDDVFGDDPTVQELEQEAASMFGKDSALFVPTGTMSNLAAVIAHCAKVPFPELIVGKSQHIFLYESGGVSRFGGVHTASLENNADTGEMDLNDIEGAIRQEDVHCPNSALLCLENTINGIPVSTSYVDRASKLARAHGMKVHMDGARIFNASTALGQPVSQICKSVDTVSCCLSKGLGSPVGSVLIGDKAFIKHARHVRKALGGGMRQVGVLAACGLISLREMTRRLHEDHEKARLLAEGLGDMKHVNVDLKRVKTNMVFFDVDDDKTVQVVDTLKKDHNILIGAYTSKTIRAVTHNDVSLPDIQYTLDAFHKTIKSVFS